MRKHWIVLSMCISLLLNAAVGYAGGVQDTYGLVEENGRVIGSLLGPSSFVLQIDMDTPVIASEIKQYKLAWLSLSQEKIAAFLSGKTQPPLPGEVWNMLSGKQTEHRQFVYREDSMRYVGYPPVFTRTLIADTPIDPVLAKIDSVTKSLMDDIGLDYEYPFYTLCNAAYGLNNSLRGTAIHTSVDAESFLSADHSNDGQIEYQYLQSHDVFQAEFYYVRVRLCVGGIPFSIFALKSPAYAQDNPAYDEGVYVELVFNQQGEIVSAEASNLFTVVKEAENPQPPLSWQECLVALSQHDKYFSGMDTAKVLSAELCYSVNSKGISYPVWQFILEMSQPDAVSHWKYVCHPIYIDALTGACL